MSNSILISFKGSKGVQFGRETYVTMVPFSRLENFFKVFPDVQRKLNKARAKLIAKYILDGLYKKRLTFLSAITVTCKEEIEYNEELSQIEIDINTQFSINDGQHRAEGIKLALKNMEEKLSAAKNSDERDSIQEKLKILQDMTIPVVIFTGIDKKGEQQLFHDLNLLAGKPNKSIALNFDYSDHLNKLAKDLSLSNEQLKRLNVETEKTQIRGNNDQIMVLSTLKNMITYIVTGTNRDKDGLISIDNYDSYYETLDQVLDLLFTALPQDCSNRDKYIIGTAATLIGIGKYLHEIVYANETLEWEDEIKKLGEIDWSHNSPIWKYGGSYIPEKNKFVYTGTSAGINGVYQSLKDHFANNNL